MPIRFNILWRYAYPIRYGFILVILQWLIGTQVGYCSGPRDLSVILTQLDKHIQKQVQWRRIPGCAVAVVYQNKIVFMNGYGLKSLYKKEKIDIHTVFQLGSISKPIAATLASILEHKGLLKLEDPVNDYLPNFSLRSRQPSSTLKIKHILSHSSGVPRAGFNNLIESHAPYPLILKALQDTPVRTTVGKRYDYNNAMYSLISEITYAATRMPFSMALYNNLLRPLEMGRTSSTIQDLLHTPNRASPHIRKRGRWLPCESYSQGYYAVAPSGGVNSSISDMAIFLKAQMGGYPKILPHRALARLHAPQIATTTSLRACEGPYHLIRNSRYALGWRVVDFGHHQLIFHGGWLKGFTNFIAFIPEQQIGIVVLHNGESPFASKTAVRFFELFLDVPQRKKIVRKSAKTASKPIKIIKKSKQIYYP